MEIQTISFVSVRELLVTPESEEAFQVDDLPWTFGDSAYTLIDKDMFSQWVSQMEKNTGNSWTEVRNRLDMLAEKVLISL